MALVLLVFSSVFIGLFIGAEYQLGLEKRKNSDGRPTVTITATNTEVGTTTTTWGTTATETTTATTIGPPIPLPTKEPEVVIHRISGTVFGTLMCKLSRRFARHRSVYCSRRRFYPRWT